MVGIICNYSKNIPLFVGEWDILSSLEFQESNIDNTKIYNNDFISPDGNPHVIISSSEDIQWYNEDLERGNYWFNYTTQNPGASHNGIYWNTPYEVAYSSEVYDNYPLVSEITRKNLNAHISQSGD